MSATSTKGLETWLTTGDQVPTSVTPTAISKAKPAVVTVADTSTIFDGDLALVENTGFPELDGKYFPVGAVATGTFELVGSDTTNSSGVLAGTPTVKIYSKANQVKMCLATVDPATETPGTTSVGTFCDPSATIPALAQAGTITMTGYVELTGYYDELNKAVEDGMTRVLTIVLPQNLGQIVVPIVLSSIGWQTPLDGAVGFTVSGAMSSKPRHLY